MSMVWIAVLVLSAPPSEGAVLPGMPQAAGSTSVAGSQLERPLLPPRSGRELEKAAHAALRRWAKVGDADAGLAARQFIVLYKELQSDTRMAASQRDELRAKIRGRLAQLSQVIARHEARLAKHDPDAVAHIGKPGGVLAQQAPGFGGQGAGMGVGGAPGGGPGNADDDYGPSLVELIQNTISPESWDVNGGAGSIYYWRGQRALVVRATGDVHDAIGGVLEQLDRAGN
jgi:hypothetical protein